MMTTSDARLQIDLDAQDVILINAIVRTYKYSIDTLDFGAEATKLILNKKTKVCRVNPAGTVDSNTATSNQMRRIMVWLESQYEPNTKTVLNDVTLATREDGEIILNKSSYSPEELVEVIKLITDTAIVLK